MAVPVQTDETVTHPLDPLTATELAAVVSLLRAEPAVPDRVRFVTIALDEPSKHDVAAYRPGTPIERRANVVLADPVGQSTLEARVDLTAAAVTEVTVIPGVQAAITVEEYLECEQLVRADPGYRAALEARGITDFDLVTVEAGASEGSATPAKTTAGWAGHPPGFATTPRTTLRTPDRGPLRDRRPPHNAGGANRGSRRNHDAPGKRRLPARGDRRAPHRSAPARDHTARGPKLHGRRLGGVAGRRWRLRVGFTPREGLVLHTIGFEDGDRMRPIIHRASFAELVIPYGDADARRIPQERV